MSERDHHSNADRSSIRSNVSEDLHLVNLDSESEPSDGYLSNAPSVSGRSSSRSSSYQVRDNNLGTPGSRKRGQKQKTSSRVNEDVTVRSSTSSVRRASAGIENESENGNENGESLRFTCFGENTYAEDEDEAEGEPGDNDLLEGDSQRGRRLGPHQPNSMMVDVPPASQPRRRDQARPSLDQNQNQNHASAAEISAINQLSLARGLLPNGQRARADSRLDTLVEHAELMLMPNDEANERLEEFRRSYQVAQDFIFQKVTRRGDQQPHITDLREDVATMGVGSSPARLPVHQRPGAQTDPAEANRLAVGAAPPPAPAQNQQGRGQDRQGGRRTPATNPGRPIFMDRDERHVASQQIDTVSLLMRITPTLMTNIVHYVTQLFARRHLESLVDNGTIQPRLDPNNPASFVLNPHNRNLLVADVGSTISPQALTDGIAAETRRMRRLRSEIVHLTALSPAIKSEVNQKSAHLDKVHLYVSTVISTISHLVYSETTPFVASAATLDGQRIGTVPFDTTSYDFILRISHILNSLNIRKGPNPNRFYMERYVDLYSPTKFWRPESTIEDVISALLRDRASIGDKLHEHWTVYRDQTIRHIKQSDETLIPSVKPRRHFVAFRNGWLDLERNLFFERGSPSCNTVMNQQVERYDYALNYFDGNFDTSGYSRDTGEFDWTDRIPQEYNANGWIDWRPELMPEKHWSREPDVDIVSHAIRTQQWDFHTEQNFWFSAGRALRPAVDRLQVMFGVFGKPDTGKSTICEMILNFFPKDRVMVFAANGERVFQLQTLIEPTEDEFHKYIAAVLDLNGSTSLPCDFICNVASQEYITTPVKNGEPRTAKCDMPMLWAGNKFLEMAKSQMPALLRRFWIFMMNIKPRVCGDMEVNGETMARAMPAFIRRLNLVFHEFQVLKRQSPSANIRKSLMIWEFASSATRTTMLSLAKDISTAAHMLASANWFVRDAISDIDNWIPLEVLRMIAQYYYCVQVSDFKRRMIPPKETDFSDAIHILWPGRVFIEEWGSLDWKDFIQSGATTSKGETYDNMTAEAGYKTKFNGVTIRKGDRYVRGLVLNPERLAPFLEFLKATPTGPQQQGQQGGSDVSSMDDGALMPPPSVRPMFGHNPRRNASSNNMNTNNADARYTGPGSAGMTVGTSNADDVQSPNFVEAGVDYDPSDDMADMGMATFAATTAADAQFNVGRRRH